MSCRRRGSRRPVADRDREPREAHEWCRRFPGRLLRRHWPQPSGPVARICPWSWLPASPEFAESCLDLHAFRPRLPGSPPGSAPTSSPSAPSAHQPDDQEQQYRTDRGRNDRRDNARTEVDPKLRKCPARNEGAHYSHDEIADEAEARALDDLARQPAGGDADDQYDEKAFS